MIDKNLEEIVREERQKQASGAYIRNALKEYLQVLALYAIYTNSQFNKTLIFTGGTCLRHFFELPRLSEDLDFDYTHKVNINMLQQSLTDFFKTKLKYPAIESSVKQQGRQILIKFPVLHQLGLAQKNESNLLYVKVDVAPNPSTHYSILTGTRSKYGFNFAAKYYDLPALMAGKLHAILTRRFSRGATSELSIKGRDYFDLLWFVKKAVIPNMQRLSEMLGKSFTWSELEAQIDHKVHECTTHHKESFARDLLPMIDDPSFIKIYVTNFEEEYHRSKTQSFGGDSSSLKKS